MVAMYVILLQLNYNHTARILPMWPTALQPVSQSDLISSVKYRSWTSRTTLLCTLTKNWVMLWFDWVVSWIGFCYLSQKGEETSFIILLVIHVLLPVFTALFSQDMNLVHLETDISFRKDPSNIFLRDNLFIRFWSVFKNQG